MNTPVVILVAVALVLVIINELSAIIVGEEKVTVKTIVVFSLVISAICVTHNAWCALCL